MKKTALVLLMFAISQKSAFVHAQSEPEASAVDSAAYSSAGYSSSSYQTLSGTLSSVGSETLSGLMTRWMKVFQQHHPSVNLQLRASGSSATPIALTQGLTTLGAMSRPMKESELKRFYQQHGYMPTQLMIANDGIGIFVHRENPLKGLSLRALDGVFSSTLRCGLTEKISHWSQLGISPSSKTAWFDASIQRFGRNSASGTYAYMKENALCGGDFDTQVEELLGAAGVVESVAWNRGGIGYSGITDKASNARLLPLSYEGEDYVFPTADNILNGRYPLTRHLFLYVNQAPDKKLPEITRAFIAFIYSDEGQQQVRAEGYIPISSTQVDEELEKIRF